MSVLYFERKKCKSFLCHVAHNAISMFLPQFSTFMFCFCFFLFFRRHHFIGFVLLLCTCVHLQKSVQFRLCEKALCVAHAKHVALVIIYEADAKRKWEAPARIEYNKHMYAQWHTTLNMHNVYNIVFYHINSFPFSFPRSPTLWTSTWNWNVSKRKVQTWKKNFIL